MLGGSEAKDETVSDSHKDDDFFDQPGLSNPQGGDGGSFDKLAEARFADAEESWESRASLEGSTDNEGTVFSFLLTVFTVNGLMRDGQERRNYLHNNVLRFHTKMYTLHVFGSLKFGWLHLILKELLNCNSSLICVAYCVGNSWEGGQLLEKRKRK